MRAFLCALNAANALANVLAFTYSHEAINFFGAWLACFVAVLLALAP